MEKLTAVVLFRTVLLLAGLNAALAQEDPVNVAVGETLKLSPPFSESISSLLWKHEGDMVIEWVKDKLDKTYGNFKNRTNMDTTTGVLEIMKMTAADAGVYTVEINKKEQGRKYRVNVMNKVPKPSVEFQPLACPTSDSCGLSCDGDTEGAGTVEYSWKIGLGRWEKGEKTMSINRESHPHDKTFTCKIENPVSVEESEPKDNPFYKGEVPVPQSKVGTIVGAVIGSLLVIIAIATPSYIYREKVATAIQSYIGGNGPSDNVAGGADPAVKLTETVATINEVNPSAAENGATSPSENSTAANETEPLAVSEAS